MAGPLIILGLLAFFAAAVVAGMIVGAANLETAPL